MHTSLLHRHFIPLSVYFYVPLPLFVVVVDMFLLYFFLLLGKLLDGFGIGLMRSLGVFAVHVLRNF